MEERLTGDDSIQVSESPTVQQLYSPAMLAELLGVSVMLVRRWYRAGLLQPATEVLQLPQFDFAGLAAARRLAEWSRNGLTVTRLQQQLEALRQRFGTDVAVTDLPIVVDGKRLVLVQDGREIEASGQMLLPFEQHPAERQQGLAQVIPFPRSGEPDVAGVRGDTNKPLELDEMLDAAMAAEDELDFPTAVDWYRAALTAHGPRADVCFQLAELLYRMGDLEAARERYFMALELDPNLVEARASLGCVLAEEGQLELAVAAFEGALRQYPDYADVHFHLARVLDDLEERHRAVQHWLRFLQLAPDSPWAEEARARLRNDAPLIDF